ncbi:sensor domain-containing diguanylate cyclase [Paraburkholderia aromaticivorans]|uniref:diguanylate cyclase n=1 Tax=Paraburkholderia aromaticivorans TaxID=2026199 RepID=A0A248W001_9BURK|nr:sensor domain-containing diguanylate cyclase [Paraburkholderia aromaticivorans]ASW04433.1 diguanylate cyclase [Paraburkholderia aromaticivorans]
MSLPDSDKRLFALITSPRVVIGSGVILAFAMLSICAFILYGGRQDALEHASDSSRNTMLVIERDIERNIELYDLSLQAVVDGLYRPNVIALSAPLKREVLFDRAATAQYLGTIVATDAAGNIILDSRNGAPPTVNLANRNYFQVQRDHPAWGLYISPPQPSSLLGGDLALTLSRRITNPDGSFAGIVAGTVNLDYLHHLLSGLTLGPHGVMALVHTGGALIMRAPYNPKLIGHNLSGAGPFTKMSASSEGSFADTASIDGIRRIYAFKHLRGLPLIMVVAPAEQDIYAKWRMRAQKVVGVMILFSIAFVGLAVLLAYSLGKKAKAESTLRMLARTDSLTGLNNRRMLDQLLEQEWRRAVRTQRPLSILFVDLDRFKAYNDTYGHQAGDDVLAAVARCIARQIRRAGDITARYGGEEFVIVLPDTDSMGALAVAETLRQAVAHLAIEHAASELGRVTVSIGSASWQGRVADSVASVVKAADEALYQAKADGRNSVFGAILH